jgi:hypothetical protein
MTCILLAGAGNSIPTVLVFCCHEDGREAGGFPATKFLDYLNAQQPISAADLFATRQF